MKKTILTSITVLFLTTPSLLAVKIFEPNDETNHYELNCLSWYDHTPHTADADASCNPVTGYVGAYANAFLGAGTAEAQQKIIVTVPDPNNTPRTIHVLVEITRSGGAETFGYGGFAGTEKTWAVGSLDNYHRKSVDDWLTYESAILKIAGVLGIGGSSSAILAAIDNISTGYSLGLFFAGLLSTDEADTIYISFDYEVPAGVTVVPIWAGLRATASAVITGWGEAISVGQVKRFTIYEVDPPAPPVISGPVKATSDNLLEFDFLNPFSNGEDVRFWIDWDDTTPIVPEITGWIDANHTETLFHTYTEPGQYEIRVKSIAQDGSSSLYATYNIYISPPRPTGVLASNGNFTDKVRVTWDDVNDANEYRVYLAASPNSPKRVLGRWQSEISYDHYSNANASTYFYWVGSRKERLLESLEVAGHDPGWRSVLHIDPDLNGDGSEDVNDIYYLIDYWLQSGGMIFDDINEPNELVNMRHFALLLNALYGTIPTPEELNLLIDGSFEIDDFDNWPDFWDPPQDPCCQSKAMLDTTISFDGIASVKVEDCSGEAYFIQELPIDPCTAYTLSAWIKTSDVNVSGLSVAFERQESQQWNIVAGTDSNLFPGTTDWLQRQVTFTTPGDITDGRVVCNFGGMTNGVGWLDYISLMPADIIPPNIPQSLQVADVTDSRVTMSWDASTDNGTGVAGYNIYCDGNLIDSTGSTTYTDAGLNPLSTYSYTVSAYDRSENHSAESNSVEVTTDTGPNLVSNGSFENGLSRWNHFPTASWDNNTPPHHGNASMHVVPGAQSLYATQQVSLIGRTEYTLSAWIKTDEIHGLDASPIIIVYQERDGQNWETRGTTIIDPVPATTDWTQRSVTFLTPSSHETGRVMLYWAIIDGQAWFDDVKLTIAE
jgi:hypothetical protein